jgi:hypothetical protein
LFVVLLIAGCTASNSAEKPRTARENIERFRKLDAALAKPSEEPIPDDVIMEAVGMIEADITDDQLPDLEGYALSRGTKDVRWPIADLFIDRGRYDSAARIYVAALVDRPGDRSYGMWKRWELLYGQRPDYQDMGKQLCESLLKTYADATPPEREVIAEIFGLPPATAKLSPTRFREAFKQDTRLAP